MSKACFSGVSSLAVRVVGERRVDAALRGAGVAAAGVDLAEDRHVHAGRLGLDGGAQPGEPAADHDQLMVRHAAPPQLTQTQRAQMP